MKTYDLYTASGDLFLSNISLERAADSLELDSTEMLRVITEEGRCDTNEGTVVEHGQPMGRRGLNHH